MIPQRCKERCTPLALALAVAAVGLLCSPRLALAKRVVVLSVSGPGYKPVRRFLEAEIEESHTLIPMRRALAASRDLDLPRRQWFKGDNLHELARKIGADAVVTARIYKYRHRWWIGLQVRDGATGRVAKQGLASYRWLALNRKNKARLRRFLMAGIDRVQGVEHPRRRVASPLPARPRPTDEEARRARKAKAGPLGPRPAWMTGVNAGVGMRVLGRSLSLKGAGGVAASQTVYDTNTPVLPLTLEAETYPGAFFSRNAFLANLGLGFRLDYAFGVVSRRASDNTEISTTVWNLDFWLTWRWNVKKSTESPELYFDLGLAVSNYSFAQDLGAVPSVRAVSIKPAIRGRFSVMRDRLTLGFAVGGLATLAAGQMTNPQHYGAASAGGLHLAIELGVRLFWKVYLRAGVQTTWTFFSFQQTGTQGVDFQYEALSARDGTYGAYALAEFRY